MNKLKRLGDATLLEFKMAETPVFLAMACCLLGVVTWYFSMFFTLIFMLVAGIAMCVAMNCICEDNFLGRNMVFCRQFGFSLAETIIAKMTVMTLVTTMCYLPFFGVILLESLSPENYSRYSLITLTDILPSNIVQGMVCFILTGVGGAMLLSAFCLAWGAHAGPNVDRKGRRKRSLPARLLGVALVFCITYFRPITIKKIHFAGLYGSTAILLTINICLIALMIYLIRRKLREDFE